MSEYEKASYLQDLSECICINASFMLRQSAILECISREIDSCYAKKHGNRKALKQICRFFNYPMSYLHDGIMQAHSKDNELFFNFRPVDIIYMAFEFIPFKG